MTKTRKRISSKCCQEVDLAVIKPGRVHRIFIMLHGYGGSIDEVEKYFPLTEYAEKYNILIAIPELGNRFYLDVKDTNFLPGKFLSEELPEYLKKEYNLSQETKVILGGYSMGGFGTMLHGLNNREKFSALISVSGAFVANEIAFGSSFVVGTEAQVKLARDIFMLKENELPIDALMDDTDRNPEAAINQINETEIKDMPQIIITCGTKDIWYESSKRVTKKLMKKDVSLRYLEIKDGEHDFTVFDQGFRFAFDSIN